MLSVQVSCTSALHRSVPALHVQGYKSGKYASIKSLRYVPCGAREYGVRAIVYDGSYRVEPVDQEFWVEPVDMVLEPVDMVLEPVDMVVL